MILLTGGTGFLGAHLLYRLCADGHKVRALKRKTANCALTKKIFAFYSEQPDELFNGIEWVEGDLLDIDSLSDAMRDMEHVYHAAAVVSFQGSDQDTLLNTNITGTANMVNIALDHQIKKLCYVSSISSLGRAYNSGIVSEETHWNNKKTSVYSTSKYEAEREVWRGMAEGLNAVIVNPSIIIGPGNWQAGSPQLFETMWKGLLFYTSGGNGFVDVNDVVACMIALMQGEPSNERYIINSENIPYKQLFEWIAEALGVPPPRYKAGPFLSGLTWRALAIKALLTGKKSSITRETAETANRSYYYDNAKIKKEIGIDFMPIRESIFKTAAFFLNENTK